ncbi:hypothetical protein PMAYCL1PPCAC_30619 [Pristionchus mayeri]|uniref:diacylglycerol O-acyltransferase n=1 Tax=Pristionchus mayeri TaxID=1317129 RepID=A0AAN5DC72_9BILA|nr:hypothetical protein PMAYCL1PPCAC_30619 [Pristionchus mayeri]
MRDPTFSSLKDWLKICGFVYVFCGMWMFLPPVIVISSLYLLYVKFYAFFPIVLIYSAWYIYSKDWPESGCMKSEFFRRQNFCRWAEDYFQYKLVKTAELPADRNYLCGHHPHGMGCFGLVLGYSIYPNSYAELYKGLKGWCGTLTGQFVWPLRREILMLGGCGIASTRNLKWIFGQEEKSGSGSGISLRRKRGV